MLYNVYLGEGEMQYMFTVALLAIPAWLNSTMSARLVRKAIVYCMRANGKSRVYQEILQKLCDFIEQKNSPFTLRPEL